MISSPIAVFLALAAVVLLATWLEDRYLAARVLGSVLLAIVLAAVLANAGVLPGSSSTYDLLGGIGVNVAIALILLGVDVRSVVQAGPRMLVAFVFGAVGTMVGAVAGALLLHVQIGPDTWKLAGQYTGTYIGGGVNMVAVGKALGTSPDVFSAAVAADNVTTTIWMIVCFGLAARVRPLGQEDTPGQSGAAGEAGKSGVFVSSGRAVVVKDVAALAVLAAAAVWLAGRLAVAVPGIPNVLWLTTIALVGAQFGPVRRLAGGPVLGNYLLQLFLAGLGAQSIVAQIVKVGPAVFWFTLVVVAVHGLLLFGAGRLARLDLPTLLVASQANVGGPASAMALATARGYTDRLLPGIAVGLVGYALGNYAGFGVAAVVQRLLT